MQHATTTPVGPRLTRQRSDILPHGFAAFSTVQTASTDVSELGAATSQLPGVGGESGGGDWCTRGDSLEEPVSGNLS